MKDIDLKQEIDRFEDETVLKKAVLESFEKDIEAFDAIGEMEADPDFKKKMDQAFARGVKQGTKNVETMSKVHRLLKRISFAVALLLIVLVPSSLYVNASARETIVNFLISNFTQFSTIKYDSNNEVCRPLGWDLKYYPLVVPQSYRYKEVSLTNTDGTIWFEAPSGNYFSFSVFDSVSEISFDTENMESSDIEIAAHPATLFMSKDGIENALLISLPDYFIIISGNLTEEELIQIGSNVHGI